MINIDTNIRQDSNTKQVFNNKIDEMHKNKMKYMI